MPVQRTHVYGRNIRQRVNNQTHSTREVSAVIRNRKHTAAMMQVVVIPRNHSLVRCEKLRGERSFSVMTSAFTRVVSISSYFRLPVTHKRCVISWPRDLKGPLNDALNDHRCVILILLNFFARCSCRRVRNAGVLDELSNCPQYVALCTHLDYFLLSQV